MTIRQRDMDMTEGNIAGLLWRFALPIMLGLLFQQLYNTVDAAVVGKYVGKAALAAVGSTQSIVNTLVGFCAGLSTGTTVVISQCYGAHDGERLHRAVQTTVLMTFILGAIATAAGIFAVPTLLRFMKTPDDVFAPASEYLGIYFSGVAGLLIYNMGSGILRAVGDSRRPLYFLMLSAALNVGLDLLFVVKFHWGIAGAAYATIASQFISAALVLTVLTLEKGDYRIAWQRLAIDAPLLKQIFRIGLPAAVQQTITAFSNVFVQSYINAFQSSVMAGWSCYNKIDVFVMLPLQSIGMACVTFVAQNYGAGNMGRARKGVSTSLLLSLVSTAALIVGVLALRRPLVGLFTDEADVMEYGVRFLTMILPFYLLFSVTQNVAGALRGIGDSRKPMILMLASFVVFRQLYLFVNDQLGGGLNFVVMSYPAGWTVCATLLIIAYHRSRLFSTGAKPKADSAPSAEQVEHIAEAEQVEAIEQAEP